jgi:hypothetical protein
MHFPQIESQGRALPDRQIFSYRHIFSENEKSARYYSLDKPTTKMAYCPVTPKQEGRQMSQAELNGIKQLLSGIVAHLETLTMQIAELRPLKQISPEYRIAENKVGQSIHTDMRALRQLADTVLDKTDAPEGES